MADQAPSNEPQLEEEIATEAFPMLDDIINCPKNPGHKKFLPYNEFKMHHLPPRYRSEKLYRYLKNVGDSVVRLTVTCEDGSKRFGSGVVWKYRGVLYIYTNNHVVETDFQAKNTVIDFYYDYKNCPDIQYSKGTSLVYTFSGMDKSMITFDPVPKGFDHFYMPDSGRCRGIIKVNVDGVEIECRGLTCVHKDKTCVVVRNKPEISWTDDLAKQATAYFREFDERDKIYATFSGVFESNEEMTFLEFDEVPDMIRDEMTKEEHFWESVEGKTYPVVIAHPHGGPKMVTIGRKIELENKEDMGVVLHHSAGTCGGSSGGAVVAIGGENKVRGLYSYAFLHCQGCKSDKYTSQTGSDNVNTSSLSIWL
ncbi:hypothetical protein LOTGIDRAFT_233741 [Lottia gigantea]|uniref:Serine protease n=1 Tax=Lottia gigantea TaxID=225164 RepID=V4A6S0_LOTGI|nr:hypothetical protein LOTGIDRAFT_233741 [Lottia gigantea]ESO90720.1 hypothetical protein LOTGIDRAFT_233741 [Lottia gigantea]